MTLGAPEREARQEPIVLRSSGRTHQHSIDPADDGRGTSDVVKVEVGEHEQVDPPDAELAEAIHERLGIRPGVDEHHESIASGERSRRPARHRTPRTASRPGDR